ncbi:hypothetical protein CYMTET_56753 [Cymbomonas tetramitiformis]|uniref:Sacsin/Nov domain-containing protein n=1 Tax=Cymbomonas tetramitiformis TaxID=36881 RepID=A0AAE0BAA3_9CHLO|nr:hypothetical protein CYMTET_56753 [Cymbomonas tetramitiformis]
MFSDADFDAICKLGVGSKQTRAGKIGRFGVGFSSVYNFTDVPTIFSNKTLLILDPHVAYLTDEYASNAEPGVCIDFTDPEAHENISGHFWTCDGLPIEGPSDAFAKKTPYQGSLFRIPFRSTETAKESQISDLLIDTDVAKIITQRLLREIDRWLLFLNHVRDIQVTILDADGSCTTPIHAHRRSLHTFDLARHTLASAGALTMPHPHTGTTAAVADVLSIGTTMASAASSTGVSTSASAASCSSHARVRQQDTRLVDADDAADGVHYLRVRNQGVGVALQIRCSSIASEIHGQQHHGSAQEMGVGPAAAAEVVGLSMEPDASAPPGRIFCFLPLPCSASLGVRFHVHAPFHVAQDRRSVLLDAANGLDVTGTVQHNLDLLRSAIPREMVRLLVILAAHLPAARGRSGAPHDGTTSAYFALFPRPSLPEGSPGRMLSEAFYTCMASIDYKGARLLPCRSSEGDAVPATTAGGDDRCPIHLRDGSACLTVVAATDALFTCKAAGSKAPGELYERVSACLARRGTGADVAVVDAPPDVLQGLRQAGVEVCVLEGGWLRRFLTSTAATSVAVLDASVRQTADPPTAPSSGQGRHLHLAPEEVADLLELGCSQAVRFDTATNAAPQAVYLVEDPVEATLLQRAPQITVHSALKEWDRRPKLRWLLEQCAIERRLQVHQLTVEALPAVLREVLPSEVQPGGGDSSSTCVAAVDMAQHELPVQVIECLWKWLQRHPVNVLQCLPGWALLPGAAAGYGPGGAATEHDAGVSVTQGRSNHQQQQQQCVLFRLHAVGTPECRLWDNSAASPALRALLQRVPGGSLLEPPPWMHTFAPMYRPCSHPPTGSGLVAWLHASLTAEVDVASSGVPGRTYHAERLCQALRDGLCSDRVRDQNDAVEHQLVQAVLDAHADCCDCRHHVNDPTNSSNGAAGGSFSGGPASWQSGCLVLRALPVWKTMHAGHAAASCASPARPAAKNNGCVALLDVEGAVCLAPLKAAALLRKILTSHPGLYQGAALLEQCRDDPLRHALLTSMKVPAVTWDTVLQEYLLPGMRQQSQQVRESVMGDLLDRWSSLQVSRTTTQAMRTCAFVVNRQGQLVTPRQLLAPLPELCALYSDATGVNADEGGPFPPANSRFAEHAGLLELRTALSAEELMERVVWCEVHPRCSETRKIAHRLAKYLEASADLADGNVDGRLVKALRERRWMPAAERPSDWPQRLPWMGAAEGIADQGRLYAAWEVLPLGQRYAAGCVCPLVEAPGSGLLKLLGVAERANNAQTLLKQLHAIEEWAQREGVLSSGNARFVTECLRVHVYPCLTALPNSLWMGNSFVDTNKVATSESSDFPPYLWVLPPSLQNLPMCKDIKTDFSATDIVGALSEMRSQHGKESTLDHFSLELAVGMLMRLADIVSIDESTDTVIISRSSIGSDTELFVPTVTGKLRSAHQCAYNDMPWISATELAVHLKGKTLIHKNISNDVARSVGVGGLALHVTQHATSRQTWAVPAGQSEALTTRIRNLLKDYPGDATVLKELVQNADDAGADEVHFVWDWRPHTDARESTLTSEMKHLQGPCLWAFNNARFKPADFDSLCKLGVGGKRSDTDKIGRFGVGFNSVYNFTDVPSVLSGSQLLILDPRVKHLEALGASAEKPGIKLLLDRLDLCTFEDQWVPYRGLPLGEGRHRANEMSRDYDGTLIRMPFRSRATADSRSDELSDICMDEGIARKINRELRSELDRWLLFLNHVRDIQVTILDADGSCTTPIHAHRRSLHTFDLARHTLASAGALTMPHPHTGATAAVADVLSIGSTMASAASSTGVSTSASAASCSSPARVRQQDTRLVDADDAADGVHYLRVRNQGVGIALQIRCSSIASEIHGQQHHGSGQEMGVGPAAATEVVGLSMEPDASAPPGRIFCFLPLPCSASLGVRFHVHAPFHVAQDRRSVLLDAANGLDVTGTVQHNLDLLRSAIPREMVRLLVILAAHLPAARGRSGAPHDGTTSAYFALFPRPSLPEGSPGRMLSEAFYTCMASIDYKGARLLPCRSSEGDAVPATTAGGDDRCPIHLRDGSACLTVVAATDALFTCKAAGSKAPGELYERVSACLARRGTGADVAVVDAPPDVLQGLRQAGVEVCVLEGGWLRRFLTSTAATSVAVLDASVRQTADPPTAPSSGQGRHLHLAPEEVADLLELVAHICLPSAPAEGDLARSLTGMPLLLLQGCSQAVRFDTATNAAPQAVYLVEDPVEATLLQRAPQITVHSALKEWDRRPKLRWLLEQCAIERRLQVHQLTVEALPAVLREVLPSEVQPGGGDSSSTCVAAVDMAQHELPVQVIECLWKWLQRHPVNVLQCLPGWALLPGAAAGYGPGGAATEHDAGVSVTQGRSNHHQQQQQCVLFRLHAVGTPECRLWDNSAASPALRALLQRVPGGSLLEPPPWMHTFAPMYRPCSHPPTGSGLVAWLHASLTAEVDVASSGVPGRTYHAERLCQALRDGLYSDCVRDQNDAVEHQLVQAVLDAHADCCDCRHHVNDPTNSSNGAAGGSFSGGPASWQSGCLVLRALPVWKTMHAGHAAASCASPARPAAKNNGCVALLDVEGAVCLAPLKAAALLRKILTSHPGLYQGAALLEQCRDDPLRHALLTSMKVPAVTWDTVLQEYLLPGMRQQSQQVRESVMGDLLDRWSSLQVSRTTTQAMRTCAFVVNRQGQLVTPRQLLAPLPELCALYSDATGVNADEGGPFPPANSRFAEHASLLELRTALSAEELMERVVWCEAHPRCSETRKIVHRLAKYLEASADLADGNVDGRLVKALRERRWMPAAERPSDWPQRLPWMGAAEGIADQGRLYAAWEVLPLGQRYAAGCVCPLVEAPGSGLLKLLGVAERANTQTLLKQLHAIEEWAQREAGSQAVWFDSSPELYAVSNPALLLLALVELTCF